MRQQQARDFLARLYQAAIDSAAPALRIPACLPSPPRGRTLVLGAGKAAAAMAAALEACWPGELSGLVVTRHGYEVPCARIEVVAAAHPVPDGASQAAALRMLERVGAMALSRDDLVICLMSGGGSSLLALPLPGMSLADKQAIARALLASGASIGEMNCVRRHLSAIKGGRLAAACSPARVATLLVSDVPGDAAFDIASGPSVGDPTTCAQALEVLERYDIEVPAGVATMLREARSETVKPGDARLGQPELHYLATPQQALAAAAREAQAHGVPALILSDCVEGEAREVARVMAALALQVRRHGQPARAPCVLLSGGETTVTVRGSGCGGRNVEFLLALAIALDGAAGIYALAADTDGVDGAAEIAGATLYPDSLVRAAHLGLSPRRALAANDGHGFFGALGDSLVSGPTLTNVNDFRAILVE